MFGFPGQWSLDLEQLVLAGFHSLFPPFTLMVVRTILILTPAAHIFISSAGIEESLMYIPKLSKLNVL